MGELNSILKRSKFENLMAYLISEVGDNAEILDSFDDIISQSYCRLPEYMSNIRFLMRSCSKVREMPGNPDKSREMAV